MSENSSHFRPMLDLPESWVEEYCRHREPELCAPEQPPAGICLSFGLGLADRTWDNGIDLRDVAEELSDGLTIERRARHGRGEDEFEYHLTGARFGVIAVQTHGEAGRSRNAARLNLTARLDALEALQGSIGRSLEAARVRDEARGRRDRGRPVTHASGRYRRI
jgi:hypothetical protein